MLALSALLLSAATGTPCWRLDLGMRIRLNPEEQRLAVCLEVPAQPEKVLLRVSQTELPTVKLCVDGQSIDIDSRKQGKLHKCDTNLLLLPLGPPEEHISYTFSFSVDQAVDIYVGALSAGPPSPPGPHPSPRAPCERAEDNVLAICADDAQRLGCPETSRTEEITCLELDLDRLSGDCRDAMHDLSKCLLGPHLFLPMEIAFVMLLATAGTVLSCSLLKCCCRHFCAPPPPPPSEIHLDHPGELTDEEDDERPAPPAGSSAPPTNASGGASHGSGGGALPKHAAEPVAPQEADDDDDGLPAYTQVAEHGS